MTRADTPVSAKVSSTALWGRLAVDCGGHAPGQTLRSSVTELARFLLKFGGSQERSRSVMWNTEPASHPTAGRREPWG